MSDVVAVDFGKFQAGIDDGMPPGRGCVDGDEIVSIGGDDLAGFGKCASGRGVRWNMGLIPACIPRAMNAACGA